MTRTQGGGVHAAGTVLTIGSFMDRLIAVGTAGRDEVTCSGCIGLLRFGKRGRGKLHPNHEKCVDCSPLVCRERKIRKGGGATQIRAWAAAAGTNGGGFEQALAAYAVTAQAAAE